jgi:hypothetical protein
MGSTIVSSGEKVINNDLQHVFVHGAYNLGPVLEYAEIEAAIHPGEGIQYADGAGGEDGFILMADGSAIAIGVAEIDFLQIDDCSIDYTVGDNIPGLLFHWNPGALVRNISCADQVGDTAMAGTLLHSASGLAGGFKILNEGPLEDANGGTGEAFDDGAVLGAGANGEKAILANRTYMRQKYYQADASAVYNAVAYFLNS